MPIYTEEERRRARQVCEKEINRIREAQTSEQVNERGWLALGYIQAVYALEAVKVGEHCQLIKELAATEVQSLIKLRETKGQ